LKNTANQVLKGVSWNLTEQLIVQAIVFIGTVVLSRLLVPGVFGEFAMVAVVGNFASLFVGLGLSYHVIRSEHLGRDELSGLFWLNFAAGVTIGFFLFSAAGFIASFYNQPDLKIIVRFYSLGLIIQGINAVPHGLLIKAMDFKKLAVINISAVAVSYSAAILLASGGFGVWSLVAQYLSQQFTIAALYLVVTGYRPSRVFHFSVVKKVKHFSAGFTGNQILEFMANNLDSVLVGKYLGNRDLGVYSRGSALITFPVTSLGYVINRTFFPWFAALQKTPAELQTRYAQAIKALVFIMAPLILLAGMQAADVVRFVFGEKWLDMIPLVRFFAAIGLIQCINAFHDSFLVSQGKTSLLLRITFIEKTLLVVSIFIALQFGLTGLLWAKVLVLLALFIPRSVVITQVLGMAYRQWLRNFYPEVVALLIMMVMVFLFVSLLSPLNYILRLGIVSVAGLGVYYFCLRILSSTLLQEVERIVKHRISTGQYL